MRNRICETMGWPVPGPRQSLVIYWHGQAIATLTAAKEGTYEGVYLIRQIHGVPNPCFSVVGRKTERQIKCGLAQKLFGPPKKGEMDQLVDRLSDVTVLIQ